MTTGSWFVLCRRDRLLSLTEIVPRLLPLTNARVETLEPEFMEIIVDDALTGNRAKIEVYKDAEPQGADLILRSRRAGNPDRFRLVSRA